MLTPENGQAGQSPPHTQFRVFGGMRAARDGDEVDLGPWRQQVILAMLLIASGGVVSIESMADALWGEDPPASAMNQIHRHVGQLRRILEPDLPARAVGRYLLPAGTGYRLAIATEDCDLAMFRELVRRARADLVSGNTTAGVRAYLTAFELGRSPAFAGLPAQARDTPEFVAVERERIAVAIAATDAAISTGMADRALTPLLIMAGAAPFDEALQACLMRAHLATGNRAEALRVFERTRRQLVEELGVDPGPQLREAYREMLSSGWTPEDEPAPTDVARPAQLPPPIAGFVRRDDVAAALDERLADTFNDTTVVITALGGMGGIGKTALAVHWAHEIADKFPDGQLYLNLRGFDPGGRVMSSDDALSTLLASLGEQNLPEHSLEARAARYRTVLSGRRMLILLDNARDAEQVRPLLPATRGSLVIVTSRNRMASLVAREGARYIQLDRLNDAESFEFLTNRLDRARAAEVDSVHDIVAACAGLPLALAIVAARAALNPQLPLRVIAVQLATPSDALDVLSTVEQGDDLRSVFSWSYRSLDPESARTFRILTAHPGQEMSLPSLASAAGIDRANTRLRLDALVAANLLQEPKPERFSVHDFLRAYGGELLDQAGEREAAERRLIVHYVHSVHSGYAKYWRQELAVLPDLGPDLWPETSESLPEAMAWYVREQAVVWSMAELALRHGMQREAALLVLGVTAARNQLSYAPDAHVTIVRRVLDNAPGIVEPVVEAELERCVAMLSPVSSAVVHTHRALLIFAKIGDLAGQSNVSRDLARQSMSQGDAAACLSHAEQAVDFARRAERTDLLAAALLTLSEVHLTFGRPDLGLRVAEDGLAIVRANRLDQLNIYYARHIAEVSWKLGRLDQAIEMAEWGLAEAVSESNGPLSVLAAVLAKAAFDRGDLVRAERAYRRFEALIAGDGFRELVDVSTVEQAEGYRDMVAYVRARLGLLETAP